MEKSDRPDTSRSPKKNPEPEIETVFSASEMSAETVETGETSGQAASKAAAETSFMQPHTLFQTNYWACVKRHTGWKHFYLPADSGGKHAGAAAPVLCLVKNLFPGLSIVYIPGLVSAQTAHIQARIQQLAAAARRQAGAGCCFVRIDSFEPVSAAANEIAGSPISRSSDGGCFSAGTAGTGLQLKKTVRKGMPIRPNIEIQPAATVIVDCRQPLEYIRGRYRKRASRILRESSRNSESEIVCRKFSADEIDAPLLSRWYELYQETASRGKFSVRSKSYIEKLFTCSRSMNAGDCVNTGICMNDGYSMDRDSPKSGVQVSFFGAFADNCLAAGVIIAETEEAAWYLYGASSETYLKRGAMYRLQDAVIADISSRVSWYDMYGIAPENMPNHPLADLNLFKTGFGGFTVQRTGVIDVPFHPLLYSLFRFWEKRHSRRNQSPQLH